MKKHWIIYIDDFLIEKEINQWIWPRMIDIYNAVFKLFIANPYVIPSDLSTYTSQNFKRFLWEKLQERNWSSETYNYYRKSLSCYCRYLTTEDWLEKNPFDSIAKRKVPERLPKSLTKDEVTELLENLDIAFDADTFVWKRNQTMVHTYLYTGLRLSELMNLNFSNLQIYDGYITVIKWKWSKDRTIPLSKEIIKVLISYLKTRNRIYSGKEDVALFPTIHWNHLQQRDTTLMINRLRECISFHFTWHQLRHTFATELVRNNFDIYNIAQILWHSKIDTTKIYLSSDTHRLKLQLDKIPMFA